MEQQRHRAGWKNAVFLVLLAAVGAAGCAEKGSILIPVLYQAPAFKAAFSKKTAVIVSPFLDRRGVSGSLIGKRTVSSGVRNDFVIQGTTADLVAARLKETLQSRGAAVTSGGAWDLTAGGMPGSGPGILISGEITSFWIDSESVPFKTTMKAAVRMTVVAGEIAEKKIIRTLNVESKVEQETLYSDEKVSSIMSEALSSALDQILQDDVINRRLRGQ
ncbi:MAG TPA: hypothetical protein VK654_01735 [Nitrospirota bacterium]|nr:hypothetical protein [Nitrospirota bacterium]